MVNELKSISGIAVVVEGVSSNGVQSSFKFAVNAQTQDRDQLERASKAIPTLLDRIGVTMADSPRSAEAPTRTTDLDGLDDLPSKPPARRQPRAELEDDDE